MKIKKTIKNDKGFTLVELMVATSIFVVIIISSIGSLLVLLGASKDSRGLRFAMDNVNFAMESMTRSVRMGVNYYCGVTTPGDLDSVQDCETGGNLLSFVPQDPDPIQPQERITYRRHTRANGTNTIQRCVGTDDSKCIEIISSDINIEKLKFFVEGSDSVNDQEQAKVYIILKGTVTVKEKDTSFMIQTLASQRNY